MTFKNIRSQPARHLYALRGPEINDECYDRGIIALFVESVF